MKILDKIFSYGNIYVYILLGVISIIGLALLAFGIIYAVLWTDKLNDRSPTINLPCSTTFLLTEILTILFFVLSILCFALVVFIYFKWRKFKKTAPAQITASVTESVLGSQKSQTSDKGNQETATTTSDKGNQETATTTSDKGK